MVIAIDGHSACGKSTLAKDLAKALGILYIDSGAMYRASSLYFIQHNIHFSNLEKINSLLPKLSIEIKSSQSLEVYLNHVNVTEEIRSKEVTDLVSEFSAIPALRRKLVEIQRQLASSNDLVMDGRDIGSVVFPAAEIKFFLTANLQIRTERRANELRAKGVKYDFEQVKKNLQKRDLIDSTREDSPLVQCQDAIVIDNSYMNRTQQFEFALQHINSKFIKF